MELQIGSKVQIVKDLPLVRNLETGDLGELRDETGLVRPFATVVALDVEPGKEVGVQLEPIRREDGEPAENMRYEAHECDGACPMYTGWWTSRNNVEIVSDGE